MHSSHSRSLGGSRRAGERGSLEHDLERLVRPPQHRDEPALERQRLGAAVQHRDRRQPALVDAAHQDRRHQRMQRLVELIDDHRRQIGRVGLEAHPAGERQQDLARVVLFAEEALIEPLPGALAIHERRHRGNDEDHVERRAARRDVGERSIALAARARTTSAIAGRKISTVSERLASAYCRLRRSTTRGPSTCATPTA